MNTQSHEQNRLDRATRDRLAKLADAPVDTVSALARFRAAVASDDHGDEPQASTRRFPIWKRWPAWAGMAATIMLAATLIFLFNITGPSPVYAAPVEMAQLHRDLVSGKAPVTPVRNIEEARRTIETQWQEAPLLPEMPDENIHACCLRGVQSRQVACVLVRQGDVPVTVVVARIKDFKSTNGPMVIRNGREFTVQSRDGVNMVMTQFQQRWLCFMGELESDELMELAQSVAFNDDR